MWMVKNPEWFDVVVASNLFSDIITDLEAMMREAWGWQPRGTSIPSDAIRRCSSRSVARHRNTPVRSGSTPFASIKAVWMMLDHLGETDAADSIAIGVTEVLAKGDVRTADIGGSNRTSEVGAGIASRIG